MEQPTERQRKLSISSVAALAACTAIAAALSGCAAVPWQNQPSHADTRFAAPQMPPNQRAGSHNPDPYASGAYSQPYHVDSRPADRRDAPVHAQPAGDDYDGRGPMDSFDDDFDNDELWLEHGDPMHWGAQHRSSISPTAGLQHGTETNAVAQSAAQPFLIRGQSPQNNPVSVAGGYWSEGQNSGQGSEQQIGTSWANNPNGGDVQLTQQQFPELQPPMFPPPPGQMPTPHVGAPGEPNPLLQPIPPGGTTYYPQNFADLDVIVQEAQTGRIMLGGAYNSDIGLTGQIIVEERNFDLFRYPHSFRDFIDGTAWRGRGQSFRMELVPGSRVQRYLVSFGEPFLFDTPVSLNVSGYFFGRNYFDWDEQRLGGRVALGYRLTHDLSVSTGTRLESVKIFNPRTAASPSLNEVLGANGLYLGHVSLVHDTRDHPFMATEGSYLELTYSQAFGDFDYPRGDLDYRRYFLVYQRPDFSGRHTISVGTRLGVSGAQTPVFENYFAGGFSTMRGFDFRGASPVENGVRVGGRFQWLNTVEYMFPLTADDMIRAVTFVDFGTVEESVKLSANSFRVAPGFGFRVNMPAAGMGGAPLAFDFAFPVALADTDDRQIFSFYLGVLR